MLLQPRSFKHEEGQSIVLVVLAMGIFLIGAVGLGFDGSHLYSERIRAQLAADAAAQAAMMSVFDGTYNTGATKFAVSSGSSYTCGSTLANASTPCVYADKNGFNSSNGDTITLSYPSSPSAAAPGVQFASGDPTELIKVEIDRDVPTTLMHLLGPSAATVKAIGMAAIVSVNSPIPIIVIHPNLTQSFYVNGQPTVKICGGPQRSIQVNSTDSNAFKIGGNAAVDLSAGGPADTNGDCTTPGNGTDMGNWGGPSSGTVTVVPGIGGCAKGDLCIGNKGHYLQPASWMPDPLANMVAPDNTGFPAQTQAGQPTMAASATSGTITCPAWAGTHGCTVLSPGTYASGLALTNTTAIFKPGIYYMGGGNGFSCKANCNSMMATGVTDPTIAAGGTGTGWNGTQSGGGMLVYNAGGGTFNVGANGSTTLIGAPIGSAYLGTLFFEDRTAAANTGSGAHSLGGGGALSIVGTIYLTNTRSTILGSTGFKQYQELSLQGNSGNATTIQGEIIVDSLQLGGGGTIEMNLSALKSFTINQVALVQ